MMRWPWAERPLRMVWRVARDGRCSHLVGTAHFFPYSFRRPLTRLIRPVSVVLTEGPLDAASSERIAAYGRSGTNDLPSRLSQAAIWRIEKALRRRADQRGETWLIPPSNPIYFETYTSGVRPWAAFFSIWAACLDWPHSMDAEGYDIAVRQRKRVIAMESLEEQLAVLDAIPVERIVRQLDDAEGWDNYARDYVRLFMDGDLEGIIALTSRFVTRGPVVIGVRDQRMFEVMRPVFDSEDAVGFIGFPHVPGVTHLFREAGYTVKQVTA